MTKLRVYHHDNGINHNDCQMVQNFNILPGVVTLKKSQKSFMILVCHDNVETYIGYLNHYYNSGTTI